MNMLRVEALPEELRQLYRRVKNAAEQNPEFAAILKSEFGSKKVRRAGSRGKHRRARGVLDPFLVHEEGGVQLLFKELGGLEIEQLKDIISEHAMDPGKRAMKWKTAERLIELIVETVEMRSTKGSAFRE